VIVCYDGSRKAAEAVAYLAAVLPGSPAAVVTVWKPIIEETLAPAGHTTPISDPASANERQQLAARDVAEEGASRAAEAGLEAEAVVVATTGAIWEAIEKAALDLDARLIVSGTDRSGVRSMLPGSVATALVQHSSRPVMVKPSAAAAAEREREFSESATLLGAGRPRRQRSTLQR
jgi:nucleotide-binding universal stress UspA family protein